MLYFFNNITNLKLIKYSLNLHFFVLDQPWLEAVLGNSPVFQHAYNPPVFLQSKASSEEDFNLFSWEERAAMEVGVIQLSGTIYARLKLSKPGLASWPWHGLLPPSVPASTPAQHHARCTTHSALLVAAPARHSFSFPTLRFVLFFSQSFTALLIFFFFWQLSLLLANCNKILI